MKALKMRVTPALGGLLLAIYAIHPSLSAQNKPGGVEDVPISSPQIRSAANYAINAQELILRGNKGGETTKLKLRKIISAREQVVAGMKYYLRLQVTVNGQEREAEAEVWSQAWIKTAPDTLSSWKWIDQ